MRVPESSGVSHLDVVGFCKNTKQTKQEEAERGRETCLQWEEEAAPTHGSWLLWCAAASLLFALWLCAAEPVWAQQTTAGTVGAVVDATRSMQPPAVHMTAPALPQISMPAPPEPVLIAPPVAQVPHREAPRVEPKYDVTKIGSRGVGSGWDFYSLEREQALGKELAQEVEAEARLIRDPVVTEYVNRIGQNIVRNSDARVPFVIKVIDDQDVNAFALPGGYFYVNSGLILAADNEAELAGVMAHEIAHVAARHATKNATKMQMLNLATIPMIFFGGPAAYAVRQIAGLAVPMSYLKFSRDAEREADLLGIEYEYACGYDPEEFVKFFEKLKLEDKQKHSFIARAFATHPMTTDRIERAQKEIARYLPTRDQYVVDTSEFEAVKARLANLMNAHQIDAGEGVHPTLRRRDPRSQTGDNKDGNGGPTLRRKRPD